MADVDSRTLQTAALAFDAITIGGFICAVGFGVLVLAAELLIRSWQGWFAQLEAAGPFAIVAISIWFSTASAWRSSKVKSKRIWITSPGRARPWRPAMHR